MSKAVDVQIPVARRLTQRFTIADIIRSKICPHIKPCLVKTQRQYSTLQRVLQSIGTELLPSIRTQSFFHKGINVFLILMTTANDVASEQLTLWAKPYEEHLSKVESERAYNSPLYCDHSSCMYYDHDACICYGLSRYKHYDYDTCV